MKAVALACDDLIAINEKADIKYRSLMQSGCWGADENLD